MEFIVDCNSGDSFKVEAEFCLSEDGGGLMFRADDNHVRRDGRHPKPIAVFPPGSWIRVYRNDGSVKLIETVGIIATMKERSE